MAVPGSGVANLLFLFGITPCRALVSGLNMKSSQVIAPKLQPSRVEPVGVGGKAVKCAKDRVFNVGLPRTGTESFCQYGESLGYQANHQAYSRDIKPADLHSCAENASRCLDLFDTANPEQPDMFCDHPVPGIGCQLASVFPKAKFVLMTRSFKQYYPSARLWMCKWGAHKVCPGELEMNTSFSLASHVEIYGMAYKTFCEKAADSTSLEALCGDDYGESEEQVWNDMGLTELLKIMQYNHDSKLKQCISSDRLLVLDLESPGVASSIGSFLGCSGMIPEYPHVHWTGVNQKGTIK